jgi:hypothetical protein
MAENPLFNAPKADMQKQAAPPRMPPQASGRKCGCIEKLMSAQQSLRLQHWLTKSHAQHGALGGAYEGLDDLIDTFVEVMIGAKGREVLSGISSLSVGGDPQKILNDLEGVLRNEVPKDAGEKETALLNIRDEMLALVQKTRYLLTQE